MANKALQFPNRIMSELKAKLIRDYSAYYNVEEDAEILNCVIPVLARARAHAECRALSKKTHLRALESEEHVAIFEEPELTATRLREIIAFMENAKAVLVKPWEKQKRANLTAIILAADVSGVIRRILRRHRFRKNYKFSIHAICTLRIAVVDTFSQKIYINRDGREVEEFLDNIINPKPVKKKGLAAKMGS